MRIRVPAGPSYAVGLVGLVATYYAVAKFGYALRFAGPVAAIVWLPVGVGIAFLYFGGLGLWPGVLIGDLLVNDYSTLPVGSAIGQSCGNVLEVVVATALMRRLLRGRSPLEGASRLGRMLFALAAGTALSATIGGLALLIGGVLHSGSVARVWRTWWLGDLCGALIVVPLAVAWHPLAIPRPSRARVIEATLLFAAAVGLSELAFRTSNPLTYVVFPALIWAALRFGQRGATLGIAITVGFAIWNTTHFVGPFTEHSAARTILETQLYIAVTAVSTLFLASVVAERTHLAERLSASRARLVEAANAERRRLERNLHDGTQQRLTALIVRVGLARERAESAEVRAEFDAVESELAVALDELRDLAHGIHPSVLTQSGLGPAIRGIARRSAIPVELVELPSSRFGASGEVTAYYVVAEAVANAHRHAHASSLLIRASVSDGTLRLEVADDGVGGARERPGSGLSGLRDRVEAVGGAFLVESPPGRGTRVAATIPATAA